jgi:signal transduction histidine kinase
VTERARVVSGWASRALIIAIAASVFAIGWFGYRALNGWRHSATLLAEQRAGEMADRLATVLGRDMRGVQVSVLASAQWDQFVLDPPSDVHVLAASAFARYPYPESFFVWRGLPAAAAVLFLNRSDRRPEWAVGDAGPYWFPVIAEHAPDVAQALIERIGRDAQQRRRYSVFETAFAGRRHQVVARLLYRDALREHLEGVFGFTVDLDWVRDHYFPEVTSQVARIGGGGASLPLSVIDGRARVVARTAEGALPPPTRQREFSLLFFDPLLVAVDPPADLTRETWVAVAGAGGDPVLNDALIGGNQTMLVSAVAAAVFTLGLVMTVRATRARGRLADLRAAFVAAVTHDLKTPIAAIRAAGDTLARGRVSGAEALKDYALLVVQESKRLARLVDNLLAYSRITDVTEAYTMEPVAVGPLVDDVLAGFRSAIASTQFTVVTEIPDDVPPIHGDVTACRLLLDNLVDNAIRYSPSERWMRIAASTDGRVVKIDVVDHGMGIAASELEHVTRRFFRGQRSGPGGSGLGLAIATRIAADHGGSIDIRSEVDRGTTVRVTLPADQEADEDTHPRR